jgi:hypothetical protein
MISLLTPAFLAGLAALAVPLLVHLIRRERPDAVEFPSLMFLSRIPQPTVKRRRIRNLWLFALRCLALILLVGAFARPFMEQPPESFALSDHAGEIVILLDRSYSMGYGDRWDRAVASAREAVDNLGANDRATLVFFDVAAEVAVAGTNDQGRLRRALDAARPAAGGTRLAPALRVAESVLARSELARLEAVLISDFQRAGWDADAGVALPPGAVLRTVLIGGEDVENLAVTGVTMERARLSGRERVTVSAQLFKHGTQPANGVQTTLELDGRVVQSMTVDVPANGTARVSFQPLTAGETAVAATIRAGDDALPVDNVFHFVISPEPGLRVLAVEPPARDGGLYLRRALELATDPPIQLTVKRDGLPTAGELQRTDVVILNDVVPGDDAAGQRLVEWVRGGGGVIVATGERGTTTGWGDVARELAGGVPASAVDRVDVGGAQLGYIDYSHPVFEAFRAPRAGGFGSARFYRYRGVPASDARVAARDTAQPAAAVLARFDDGGAALVRHAAAVQPPRAYHHAGDIVDVAAGSQANLLLSTPSGQRLQADHGSTLLRLDEQGTYEVREARAGGATVALHAVNVDASEADLAAMDPREVVSAVTRQSEGRAHAGVMTLPREEQERRQSFWWYLLITAFVLLTTEAVVANRRSRRPA